MSTLRRVCLGALALLDLTTTGCSSARLCRGITSRADEVKLMYLEGGDTGVIKCKMAADGALTNCQPMQVVLKD